MPTPPLAPCTNSVSPGRARPQWNNAWYAVAYGTNMAAPCENDAASGNGWT